MRKTSDERKNRRILSWIEIFSPAGIALAWVWYLEREARMWLPWQVYAALLLAAVAIASVAVAATLPPPRENPSCRRFHFVCAALSLAAAGGALAIAIPTLPANLVLSTIALAPVVLIFVLYAHSLRHGRLALVPLEIFTAMIFTLAVALPFVAQRGDLSLADPILLRSVLSNGDVLDIVKLLLGFIVETLSRLLHYPPAHPFFALLLCQRLLLAAPLGAAPRRAHRAGTTLPVAARFAPAFAAAMVAVAAAAAITTPLPSKRLQMSLTACSALMLLVAHRYARGPAAVRHLALDAALILPFLAAALVIL